MQRIVSILILLSCFSFFSGTPAMAWLFSDDTLVSIGEEKYTADDFKRWWKYWKEESTPFPESPEPYINWLLLAREGKRMELDQDPGFERQTRIFLQARGLLKLKYEEVDSRIDVTEEEVRQRYEKRYLPRWHLQRLEYLTDEDAAAAWQKLQQGELSIEELLELSPKQGGPYHKPADWLRPVQINPGWEEILQGMKPGEVLDPHEHKTGFDLFYLKEVQGGTDKDFEKYRETIRGDLWKEEENALTRALIEKLRTKYDVKIDEERLATLDLLADVDSFGDEPVITTNMQNVSEKDFKMVIDRLASTRPAVSHDLADQEKAKELKADTAYNIIAQSVTNWESLDRHYEEKEPFKWLYEFNYNHRLVKAVDRILFQSKAEATEDEVRKHYEENIERFTQPTMVKVYIVDETQVPIDQIWADVAVGNDFKKLVEQHLETRIEPREVPANHLDAEVKAEVANLGEGETSRIFKAQGVRVMAHLAERIAEKPVPFDRAKKVIRSRLERENLLNLRKEHLEQIKAGTKVKVNEGVWEDVKEELEERDEA